jgi:3-deoxy-7-phosphoheptulonate synthase
MIISTKKGTPKEELEKIVDRFEKQGLDVTLITGKDYNVFGLVGDTTKIDERDVLANPWIDNVTRVSAPYKRANRLFHPADSVIDCGGVRIGGREKIAVMAGPCSIESESAGWNRRLARLYGANTRVTLSIQGLASTSRSSILVVSPTRPKTL